MSAKRAIKPKRKFLTQFDETYQGHPGITIEGVSMTIPDMTLTIKELLINHTRGISSDIPELEGHYFDTEIPVLEDLTDLENYREQLKQREKELTERIKAEQASKQPPTPKTKESGHSTPKNERSGQIPQENKENIKDNKSGEVHTNAPG